MSREWRLYLDDILKCCEKIRRFTKGMTQNKFLRDERTYDAVVRNLEIIGEAAKHVPANARKKMVGIEWRKMAGMRDWLAHAYFGIDPDIIWDVVQNKTPELEKAVKSFLKDQNA